MNILEVLATIFAITMIFSIPFAFFAFVRYLRYKETIALAERGLLRPQALRRNRDMLRWGIVILMLGVGLTCGLWPLGFMATSSDVAIGEPASVEEPVVGPIVGEGGATDLPLGIGPWMILGILPFFFGLSLIAIYWINKREGVGEGENEVIPPHKRVEQDEV